MLDFFFILGEEKKDIKPYGVSSKKNDENMTIFFRNENS